MNRSYYSLLLWFALLAVGIFACGSRTEATVPTTDQPRSIRVAPPEVLPFAGKRFHLDTMPVVPVQKIAPPARSSRNTNSFTTKQRALPLSFAAPTKVTPGRGAVTAPHRLEITAREVVAIPSGVRQLLRPGVKPKATHDIRYWNMEHGLNTYFVHGIYEDRRGYLWLGSLDDGFARFDGKTLIEYDLSALHSAAGGVGHIQEAEDGVLWLSMVRGMARFDGATFRHYDQHPLFSRGISSTCTDREGTLWAVVPERGLLRYDGGNAFTLFDATSGLPGNHLSEVVADKAGNLWFTAANVLVRFDGKHFYHYPRESEGQEFVVSAIASGPNGDVWIGTQLGLLHYAGEAFNLHAITEEDFYLGVSRLSVAPDDGTVWGNSSMGLFSFADGVITRYHQAGFSSSDIRSLLAGKEGQVWVGTYRGGLNKLSPNSFTYLFPEVPGVDLSIVKSTVDDAGDIFWGTRTQGLFQLTEDELLHYSPHRGYEHDGLVNLTTDRRGNVWLAYNWDEAVTKWNGRTRTRTRIAKQHGLAAGYCTDLITDRRGRVWGAFATGLSIIDGNTIMTLDTSLSQRWELVTGLEVGADDDVWVSTTQGLALFRGDSIYWHEAQQAFPFAFRFHLEYVPGQGLVAPVPEGLGLLTDDTLRYFGQAQGLETPQVANIETDPWGSVWADTKFGLFRVDVANQHIEPYHLADGLRSETSSPKGLSIGKDSVLWIANSSGVASLDLRRLASTTVPAPPAVYLSGLTVNESTLHFTADSIVQLTGEQPLTDFSFAGVDHVSGLPQRLSVPATANHFTFNFVAFNWSAPHKVSYRYYLEGQDETWGSEQTVNLVDYRGLGYGHYVFMVQARKRGGSWGAPLRFAFTVRPPWWLSVWAKIGYALLVTGLLLLAYYLIDRRLQLRNAYAQEQAESFRLRELDSFKSRLYTNLTHEFRTPLTVILGMARQLRDQPEAAPQNGLLIERNGERMLRLINQLLDLSKMENNALELQLQQADIIPFLQYLTNAFQTYAEGENLMLRFSTTEETLVMDYDPDQVQQIVTNLISNAIKFTPAGGAVTVRAIRQRNKLELSVTDTGIGIPPAEQAKVFNRFFQVDGSPTRRGEGTGIGLAHTHELVKIMGGAITLNSVVGEGSVFTVYLPIHQQAKMSDREPTITQFLGGFAQPDHEQLLVKELDRQDQERPLVLVIEDNADVVAYLKSCLLPTYRVAVALNGKIGTQMARELIPDLIVSDVMMPVMDGFQVCDQLKHDDKTSHIPIVLLTAKADVSSRLDGLARGADAYLAKPFVPRELDVRLEAFLKRQKRMMAYFAGKQANRQSPLAEAETEAIRVEQHFVEKLRSIVAMHFQDENFSLPILCQEIGMSRSQLFRKLKAVAGVSPSAFIRNYRLEAARKLLLNDERLTIAEIAYAVGFKEPAHFTRVFREAYGAPPSSYDGTALSPSSSSSTSGGL